jgi:hypothetical protein
MHLLHSVKQNRQGEEGPFRNQSLLLADHETAEYHISIFPGIEFVVGDSADQRYKTSAWWMFMAWRNEEEDCSAMNNLLSLYDSQGTPPSEAKEARAIYYIVVPKFSNSQVSEVSLAEWLSHSIYANKSLGVAQVSLLPEVTSSTSPVRNKKR